MNIKAVQKLFSSLLIVSTPLAFAVSCRHSTNISTKKTENIAEDKNNGGDGSKSENKDNKLDTLDTSENVRNNIPSSDTKMDKNNVKMDLTNNDNSKLSTAKKFISDIKRYLSDNNEKLRKYEIDTTDIFKEIDNLSQILNSIIIVPDQFEFYKTKINELKFEIEEGLKISESNLQKIDEISKYYELKKNETIKLNSMIDNFKWISNDKNLNLILKQVSEIFVNFEIGFIEKGREAIQSLKPFHTDKKIMLVKMNLQNLYSDFNEKLFKVLNEETNKLINSNNSLLKNLKQKYAESSYKLSNELLSSYIITKKEHTDIIYLIETAKLSSFSIKEITLLNKFLDSANNIKNLFENVKSKIENDNHFKGEEKTRIIDDINKNIKKLDDNTTDNTININYLSDIKNVTDLISNSELLKSLLLDSRPISD
ncbi:hypothetical protein [Mycoplasma zalophidermidis]|uniref:hypothetical protein n=1 Tax=Mycoplasma zalophidermidis TaxID=398174 RepID=UPI00215D4E30|nr:hypothetical protein [Mycoplasma zalophidermidis]MCR8966888.1 hypothetical protein [Mycoplasma zalophidermidis]